MTRKTYQNKMRYFLAECVRQSNEILSKSDPNYKPMKLGKSTRYTLDRSKEVAERFGSYQAAWDSFADARKSFGVEKGGADHDSNQNQIHRS